MSIIKLDSNVACQLKSHEYVLSLGSIVRELMQNSADAGASKIIIEVDSEKLEVVVRDNGCGLLPSDLNKVGSNHMTSKVSSMDDLTCLETFGFRGEALYMIGRCSEMQIATRAKGYNGIWCRNFPAHASLGCDEVLSQLLIGYSGTVVKVSNIFHNFPVRRKMLMNKPKGTLTSSLRNDVFSLLVKFPSLMVELRLNDKVIIKSNNIVDELTFQSKLCLCFQNSFGNIVAPQGFKYVSTHFKDYEIRGIISSEPLQTKDYQFIYLNGRRYLDSKFINSLDRMFQSTKYIERSWNSYNVKTVGNPYNNHPVFVISCLCPISVSDVLQDPSKTILKSEHFNTIEPLITNVMASFLKHIGYEVGIPDHKLIQENRFAGAITSNVAISSKNNPHRITKGFLTGKVTSNSRRILEIVQKPVINNDIVTKIEEKINQSSKNIKVDSEFDIKALELSGNESVYVKTHHIRDFKLFKSQIKDFDVIKQIDKKFILVRCKDMLLVLDQHACHERIKVELHLKELIFSVLNGSVELCDVNFMIFYISQEEATWLKEYQDEFEAWGIYFTFCDNNVANTAVKIERLARILLEKVKNDSEFLRNTLLQHLYELKSHRPKITSFLPYRKSFKKWWTVIPSIPTVLLEIVNSKACRSAIMFGDELSLSECEILISDLSKCQLPFYCAHGRPSVVPIVDLSDNRLPTNVADYEIN